MIRKKLLVRFVIKFAAYMDVYIWPINRHYHIQGHLVQHIIIHNKRHIS